MSSFGVTLIFASVLLSCAQPDDPVCSETHGVSLLSIKRSTVKDGSTQQVQRVQQQSVQLSHHLDLMANAMPEGSATKSLFESYRICGQCSSFQRFGEANDGGYLMCMDGLNHGSVRAAYSLGVEHHDQWSQDVVSRLGATVNQFDCTVPASDCKGCKFFKKCIVAADGKHPVPGHETEGWSLAQALAETAQSDAPAGSLLMKMDIESSEWPIYAAEPPEVLQKFGELIVEFHNLQDTQKHPLYLQAMQHILSAGFKVAHLHGNNYGSMYETGATKIPEVVEVTFIHGDAKPGGCSADQIYNRLDAPNNPTADELPLSHMA